MNCPLLYDITRDFLDTQIINLLNETMILINKCFEEIGGSFGWHSLDEAVLVGGSTRMLQVKEMVMREYTHKYGDWEVVGGNKIIPPIVKKKRCELCDDTQVYNDWSYSWITIVAAVVLVGAISGVVNYVKAFKKSKD